MDYIVYQLFPGKLLPMPYGIRSRYPSQAEAKARALELQKDWREAGAPRIPSYAVVYNGTGEIVDEAWGD